MADLTHDDIPGYGLGGAIVRRAYQSNGQRVAAGSILSTESFFAITHSIRRLFVREGRLTLFYQPLASLPPPPGTRHIIHRGAGRYDVVHGTVLNAEFLTKEGAEALAGETSE